MAEKSPSPQQAPDTSTACPVHLTHPPQDPQAGCSACPLAVGPPQLCHLALQELLTGHPCDRLVGPAEGRRGLSIRPALLTAWASGDLSFQDMLPGV